MSMRDIDRTRIAELLPSVADRARALMAACEEEGITLGITSAYRTVEEQNRLYQIGRTKLGRVVTNAQGGQSWHNWRRAFDVCLLVSGKPVWEGGPVVFHAWNIVGERGEKLGLEWGGRFKRVDRPHFQFREGLSLKDVQNAAASLDKPMGV